MESLTIGTAGSKIQAEIQTCRDRLSETQGQAAAWCKNRDEAQQKLKDTDAQIQSLESEIKRLDLDISGLGTRWARDEFTFETAKLKGAALIKTKDDKALTMQLLKGGRVVLAKRLESLTGLDPVTGQQPLAEVMTLDGKLNQQLLFWELMEKYLETGDNNVEHEMMNKANFCRFTEEERDKADQLYRQVRQERGLFHDFSCRQIGGYQKPAPWAGC